MDLRFYSNLIWIDLAFDGGDCQLCYDGIYTQGYNSIPPFIPGFFESDRMYEDLKMISELSAQDLKDKLLRAQKTNIIVSNEKYLDEIEGSRSISLTNYGVVHKCFDFPGLSYDIDLADDYWVPYSCIDIGIYKYLPNEAIVKSDLQYYNKDYVDYPLSGYIRNIKAYTMITHGGPHWEIWDLYDQHDEDIYPNEVSALWYSSQDGPWFTSVYPWHTIIMSDSCFSYYEPPSTNETMAKAFVDYHADAFVGATIKHPGDSDTWMEAFWYDLCQEDETVETSTISLCEAHGFGWDLGDEWLIYGDEEDVLAN